MVNQKHTPQMNVTKNRAHRNINEVSSGRAGSRGRGRGSRGSRYGKGQNRGTNKQTDSRMIRLTDGTHMEYHASFNSPRHIFLKRMKQEDKDTLKREHAAYRDKQSNRKSYIQELCSQIQALLQSQAT